MFINRSYWPDVEATGQLLTELAEDLAEGFEVTVLTGQPNANPNGEEFRKTGQEVRHRVSIERVNHTRFSKASKVGRVLNLLTFFIAALCRGLFVKRVDAIVVETDPFIMSLALPVLKLRHRCRTIIYLQDIYPDIAVQLRVVRNGPLIRLLRHFLFSVYRHSDRVIVLSDDMKTLCISHGIQESQISVLPNWTDIERVFPVKDHNSFRNDLEVENRFVVMHSGNMGMGQDLMPILALAEKLTDDDRFMFVFVGEGARKKELQEQVESKSLSNVRFLTYQPREKLSESLSAADLHVVAMKPEVRQCLMPSKLYGVLASGTPVLAIAPYDSELSRLVRDHELGIVSNGEDVDQLATEVKRLVTERGTTEGIGIRARRLCEERFDRRVVTTQFGMLLENTLTNTSHVDLANNEKAVSSDRANPIRSSKAEVSQTR